VEVPTPTTFLASCNPEASPGAPPVPAPRIAVEGIRDLDFADADIQDVVKQISEITGRNFILDERVRGKITIISPGKVTVDEAYKVFESVLNVKGFATIPAGKFLKIVPLREAKEGNIATYPEGTLVPERDTYVTRLIPLRYVDATDISNSLKPLSPRREHDPLRAHELDHPFGLLL
jgi:general secretion pathway protein D